MGVTKIVHEQGQGLFYFRIGLFRHIVVSMNAKSAEAILTDSKNINKAAEYDFIKPWLGNGLLTGFVNNSNMMYLHFFHFFRNGQHWRKHRKLLTPTFHFKILNKFIPIMNEQLCRLITFVEDKISDSDRTVIEDIRPIVTNCTVDIICQTAMGIESKAQNSWNEWMKNGKDQNRQTTENEYTKAVRSLFDIILYRILSPWLHPDFIFRFCSIGRLFQQNIETMHQFTNNVIMKRKQILLKDHESNPDETTDQWIKRIGDNGRIDFLDLLLINHIMDDTDFDLVSIREEVDTFMFGGHDTTSTSLQFAMLLLGINRDKQQLVHEELDQIFGDDIERNITYDDTKRMSYLEMCIKETLRLYPPAAFFARSITNQFKSNNCTIPVGTTFIVLTYAVHRDPTIYHKAEHFIPERFGPDSNMSHNPFAFIPFSAGPRNCIGQRFAMLKLKIFLSTILRRYEIRSITQQENIELDFAVISKSNTPIEMEFIRRFSKISN
ncbi:hypothetical protein RDWZM_001707 [Blomia tropicalis]|uniref:Uncharacterized protein n=1 Tax=Blomia tropicalis TaxID=40697 RepID=A0A9Q0MCN3_BLOTA|nr:hypothetical protein RDWZM_001707 [Blomia tropicalis]